MDTLITNTTVVTMNERMEVLFAANVGITDGKISYIGNKAPEAPPETIVDGTGMVLMPGLINCHTELASTLLRGYLDELRPGQALETQLSLEDKLNKRAAKAAATLGIAECLRFGITSVSDLYYFPDATAEALAESGMKGNVALSAYRFIDQNEDFDFETDEQCRELVKVCEKWNNFDNGRIRVDAGIYAEYTSNYKLWEGLLGYASEQGLGFQLRLAQTQDEADSCQDRCGLGPGELLGCHGVFRVPAAAVGCNVLSEGEKQMLGKQKASAVYMPIADRKMARPQADVLSLVRSGINVALGSGSVAEAGSADLFEVMRAAALESRSSETPIPASAALMMATVCGARAQGRAAQCGVIAEGMDADLVLVDFSAPHLIPCHNVLSGLVFSAKGGDVAMTMVRGKILYRSGSFPTLDLAKAVEEIVSYAIPAVFAEEKGN